MTPEEQRVYEQFPVLNRQLLDIVRVLAQMPLREMSVVAERVQVAGIFQGHSHGMRVDAARAGNDKKLIDATIRYMNELNLIATSPQN